MGNRSRPVQCSLYRLLLLLYPPSFRREYGALMTQAFADRLGDRGGVRTWLLVVGDLSFSVPQQILEASVMSQKWTAALAACGAALIVGSMAMGIGPPLLVLGLGTLGLAAIAFWAAKRSGRPAEFSYGGVAPKTWIWWTVLAALLGLTYLLAAAGQLISEPKGTNVGALAIAIGFAALIGGGLTLRSHSRMAGNWMIVVAAVPALTFFWIVVPAVVGLAVIIGAVTEISRSTPEAPVAA